MLKNLLIFGALSLAITSCSHLAYQPHRAALSDPSRAHLRYDDIWFNSQDGTRLHGWLFHANMPQGQSPVGTVVQFHGNAENMTSHFLSLYWMTEAGYDLFTFDYRGYGSSEGTPSQRGLNQDAVQAISFATRLQPRSEIQPKLILYGQSLGGAVLARALEDIQEPGVRSQIKAVILEGTFYSYQAIARDMLARHWITWPLQSLSSILMSDEYSPEKSFAKIAPIPLLIIHGEKDPVIPVEFGKKLFELSQTPKKLLLIPNGQHIDSMFRNDGAYRDELIQWLEEQSKN